MKKILTVTIISILMFAFAITAFAETDVEVTGQIRVREEGSRLSFDDYVEHMKSYTYLRTRLNIKAIVDENAKAFIQFQDSRLLGNNTQSGSLDNYSNVDLHQAYIKYNLWTKKDWSIGIKGGRFEYIWGNQRLLGSVGWHNVGRSWEGGLAWYDTKKFNLSLVSLKKREDNSTGYNSDFDLFGIAAKFKEINLEGLILVESDADTSFATVTDIKALERVTIAAYYKKKLEQIDMHFNLAIQGGTMRKPSTTDEELDIAAMMFTGEVGMALKGDRNGRIAIGIDYASGDDYSDSTETKVFNNLYWTGHKFNGYMDYFLAGGPNGLVDIMLRGKFDITNGWTASADLHLFAAAEEYMSPYDTQGSKDVGTELDLSLKTTRVEGVTLQFGASFFTPKDHFASFQHMNDIGYDVNTFEKKTSVWAYSQAIINF